MSLELIGLQDAFTERRIVAGDTASFDTAFDDLAAERA